MDKVFGILGRIATDAGCAVFVIHHTNKPPKADATGRQSNMYVSRGASAQVGAVRFVVTLFPMTATEAKEYGIHDAERDRYFRLDDAKANYARKRAGPAWFKFETLDLETSVEGKRESVGVPVPVTLGATGTLSTILDAMDELGSNMPLLSELVTRIAAMTGETRKAIEHRIRRALPGEAGIVFSGVRIQLRRPDHRGGGSGSGRHVTIVMRTPAERPEVAQTDEIPV
jgi:hypothetical protein